MSYDLAFNYNTGDLMLGADGDLIARTGPDVIEQEIRTRLKIQRGTWILDPTGGFNGTLGSRLLELSRVQSDRAVAEAEQYVLEALEPMETIQVTSVIASIDTQSQKGLILDITYQSVLPSGDIVDEGNPATVTLTFSQ